MKQDVENFDKWIAKAIEANGNIMVNQGDDLPFLFEKISRVAKNDWTGGVKVHD